MGKLFEIMVNTCVKYEIKTTETQAGQPGQSTADHITIMNSIINYNRKTRRKQDIYLVFLEEMLTLSGSHGFTPFAMYT